MGLELYMVGIITKDMEKSTEFYRRLGVDFPEDTARQAHVEVKMKGGLTFFVNARRRVVELDESGVIFEFYLKDRAVVTAKYEEMIGYGYASAHAPFVTSFGMYFAMIHDPDGNTVLLSAD